MSKRIFIISICSLFLFHFSCQNEVDKFETDIFVAPGDFNDALEIIQNLAQVETLDNQTGAVFSYYKLQIEIAPQTFLDENDEVILGEVEIEVIEAFRQRDFMKYNLATETVDKELLEAVAMLRLQATAGGLPVTIDKLNPVVIKVMDDGQESNTMYSPVYLNEQLFWQPFGEEVAATSFQVTKDGQVIDTTGYQIEISSQEFIAVQHALSNDETTTICLDLLDSNTPSNTIAYLLYEDINVCQRLSVSNTVQCAETAVLADYNAVLVVIAHKGDVGGREHLEAGSKPLNSMTTNVNVDLRPTLIDREELTNLVEEL